ncbi:uncharacterized protein [Nicotiana sylvestris]|uniref:Uncharacterized protein n=2 Tax=Nicotiana TaxID=4085 RepID=A0A1S4D0R1_TOBAC|nr:PREDICTED: uncharacterized protein LOC104242797 [Nicotiana sylvestris]XP_016506976.1 PREDICTED: uncharacterized protein LOC107824694 [Nicotiana tabacum]
MLSVGYKYIILLFLIVVVIGSESDLSGKSSLDSLLQEYAFKALRFPETKTGTPYNGSVPSNLSGIRISALMLKRDSLKWRGYGYYNEFFIPTVVIEEPYVEDLVLVYQNIGDYWSSYYYSLPGYTYLAPVLGILAYDASNLYATNLPELDILAMDDPITIKFPYVQPAPEGSLPKCVYFYSNNLVEFGDVTDGNICETRIQGHFAIVVEVSVAPSPSPAADEIAPSFPPTPHDDNNDHQKNKSEIWIISLVVFLVFALFGILFVIVKRFGLLEKRQRLYDSAEIVEPLLGNTEVTLPLEAPSRPLLENDYVL